ncbi:hypothetical protein GHT09_004253 [Marmota monax]|uniref:Uncharacterized protein n=1 Tax=Marmota monax TaxID=9995 RepID=A0A834V726_MARMO|nr:hypothetical protein GHT09_004253 [Marmota monax]
MKCDDLYSKDSFGDVSVPEVLHLDQSGGAAAVAAGPGARPADGEPGIAGRRAPRAGAHQMMDLDDLL